MRVGAVLRMDFTGLGIQSKEFFDHIPCKALVIDSTPLNGYQQNPNWYPGQQIVKVLPGNQMKISDEVMAEFLNDVDIVMTFETPYEYSLYQRCRDRNIRSLLQLNYEFLEYPLQFHPTPDVFASPSMWHYEDIPQPKMFLPVPVNTKKIKPAKPKEKTFLHIYGKQAVHDRNGTLTFMQSLQYVQNKITVIVRGQHHITLPSVPPNIKLIQDFTNKDNYWENYTGGVLVMPRRYGGLCLPMQESIACEMPVIATDISPNNTWLPKEWLVSARHERSFKCKQHVDVFEANPRELAAKIDEFCDKEYYHNAVAIAKDIKSKISWEALMPVYQKLFQL